MTPVERFMARARRRWWMTAATPRLGQGVLAGGLAGAAVVALGGPRPVAFAVLALGSLAGPLLAARRSPDEVQLAAHLDRAAGLGSALTAAVEFRHRDDPWCAAQRRQASRLLAGLDPAALLPWRGAGWIVGAAAAVLVVALLPPGIATKWGGPSAPLPDQIASLDFPSAAPPHEAMERPASTTEQARDTAPEAGSGSTNRPEPATAPSAAPEHQTDGLSPAPREGEGGEVSGEGGAPGGESDPQMAATQLSPLSSQGGSGKDGGDATGIALLGDIGTAAATTPLLGAPNRALARPGAATLTLGGPALPGTVAGVPGEATSTPRGMAPETTTTVTLAPPEAVPLRLRPIVARYFALLHPPTAGAEP